MVQSCKSKQKLKIAIACDIFLDGKDTRANHMQELFYNLNKFSEIYLFVPRPKEIKIFLPNIKYLLWINIPILRLILYQITLFFNLFFFCKKAKINIIYARQETFNFSPLIVSKLLNISYIVEVNGLLLEEKKLLGINKKLIALTRFSEKINYSCAVRIISVTQQIKNCIIQRYNVSDEKIVVIENGANVDLFRPMEKDKLVFNLKLDKNYSYVGYIGSFTRWHGLENLIKSAQFVLKSFNNTKFMLVGDGPLKEELFNLVDTLNLRDNFIFVGRVPHNEVPQYINIFDVCVILKDKNIPGSPLKLWEYMACGKPVVATNTNDFNILEEYNSGILTDPENYKSVADAIITLLKNNELREKMGLNGRRYVVENHSWECVAQNVVEVCQGAIKKKY